MIYNIRSVSSAILVSLFACEAVSRALELQPLTDPSTTLPGHPSKRSAEESLNLLPISDPGVLTHGHSLKREEPDNGCFDPSSQSDFYWGAYSGNNLYVANFTLYHPGDDEFILPVEKFAKRLKSIKCGSQYDPYMRLEFQDKDSFSYAKSAWDWVNKVDINRFTVVTEPDQCYKGDNRSPYLVKDIQFDANKLTASLHAEEKDWADVADEFHLKLRHEYVDPDTANITHPHLHRRDDKVMDISHSFNQNLFSFGKDSSETAGLSLSADAEISTGGHIIADFDIEKKLGFIPTDVKINIHPQGVHGDFLLKLKADGHLGKGLDYTLKPEIEIPVSALNIKGILEVGPFVTMGVHLGATGITGTAELSTGARATIDDSAEVKVKLRHPDENSISGWTPHFEKIEPQFSANIGGSVRAWAELGVEIKVEVFGRWGYQAGVDAQLPYFEANFNAQANSQGVCGTQKTIGVGLDANVGINVNLNAGEVNKAPSFQKDLFETSWPLFSTCIGIGGDNASPSTPTLEPTPVPSTEPVTTGESPVVTGPVETGTPSSAVDGSVITSAPISDPTLEPSNQPTLTGENPESTSLTTPSVSSLIVNGSSIITSTPTLHPDPEPSNSPTATGEETSSSASYESDVVSSMVTDIPINTSTPTLEPNPTSSSEISATKDDVVSSLPYETGAAPSTVEKSSAPASAPTPSYTAYPAHNGRTTTSSGRHSSTSCSSTLATLPKRQPTALAI